MFIPLYDDNPLRHLPRPYVNYSLIAVTVIAFLATGGFDERAVEQAAVSLGFIPALVNDFAVLPPDRVLVPEPATYVTYAFLHANFLHLAGNLLFLWVFGDNIEDSLGHLRYLAFYGATAAFAAFTHAFFYPDSVLPLIGASGAVAGVVGGYLVLHPKVKLWILVFGRIPLRLSAAPVLAAWALFQVVNLVLATQDEEQIAWWAHLGGFAGGVVLVPLLRRRGVPLLDRALPERPPA